MQPIHLLLMSVHFGSNRNTLVLKINKPKDNNFEFFTNEKTTSSCHLKKMLQHL